MCKKEAVISEDDTNAPDLLEWYDWIIYSRFEAKYPGASIVVGSAEFAPISQEESKLPPKGSREYRQFKRWQRGSIINRLIDFIFGYRMERA